MIIGEIKKRGKNNFKLHSLKYPWCYYKILILDKMASNYPKRYGLRSNQSDKEIVELARASRPEKRRSKSSDDAGTLTL